ncbi:MAG: ArnT family glycosyltransferase [Candidatus Heimdallarchaeota archaeon]
MGSQKPDSSDINPPQKLERVGTRFSAWIRAIKFPLLIGLLAFLVKVAFSGSIGMWDEGWFVAIASRMADGLSDPLLPLYYPAEGGDIKFFDKPPVTFWGGAILMVIFGRTTFAAKGIVALGGTGLAVIIYLLFSHQKTNKSAGVIAGLLVAISHFLSFYSRTAYIDPFVIFMGALVMLLAIRAIDAVFVERNLKKGYILIILTGIVNAFNIMTKAWQGILVGPAIVVYLIIRYLERDINLEGLNRMTQESWSQIRENNQPTQAISDKDDTGESRHPQKVESESYEDSSPGNVQERATKKESRQVKGGNKWFYIIIGGIAAFFGAGLISSLLVASIFLSFISMAGCYRFFLRSGLDKQSQVSRKAVIANTIGGLTGGVLGGLITRIFYGRLIDPIIAIADALGSDQVPWGPFEGILSIVSDSLTSLHGWAALLLEMAAFLIAASFAFGAAFLICGACFDLLTKKSYFLTIIYNLLDLIPLGIIGAWLGAWLLLFLFLGQVFNREAVAITVSGVAITLLLVPLLLSFPSLKEKTKTRLNLKFPSRSKEEVNEYISHLRFLLVAVIIVIISFFPFVAWVQFLDINIANGTFPYPIRVPGELAGDPQRPDPVTYTFLFFTYYINWRYTHGTKYNLPDSIGSAVNDYAIIVILPFFVVGIWAFFFSENRNPALGASLVAWLLTIPFVFFPAQFQLNYYYIPLIIPYMAIGAKGIEFIYSSDHWRITVTDNIERILAGTYFYIEIGFSLVVIPLITLIEPISQLFLGQTDIDTVLAAIDVAGPSLLLAAVFLIPFTFLAFRVLKTFPGIIATGFAYRYFVLSWIKEENIKVLYDVIVHDLIRTLFSLDFEWIQEIIEFGAPLVTLFGLLLLILGLYWLKPRIKPEAYVFLGLVLSAMLVNISVTAHYDQILDLRFEEMAGYIKSHGGQYNHSTWVIPEAGAFFAMRYYLGVEVVNDGNTPFVRNTSTGMENYYLSNSNIKFWVVINNSKHWHVPAYAEEYPNAYRWLTTNPHLENVDVIVGLPAWYKMHLFVNRTWITEQGYEWKTSQG